MEHVGVVLYPCCSGRFHLFCIDDHKPDVPEVVPGYLVHLGMADLGRAGLPAL